MGKAEISVNIHYWSENWNKWSILGIGMSNLRTGENRRFLGVRCESYVFLMSKHRILIRDESALV